MQHSADEYRFICELCEDEKVMTEQEANEECIICGGEWELDAPDIMHLIIKEVNKCT